MTNKIKIELKYVTPDSETFNTEEEALHHCKYLQMLEAINNSNVYIPSYQQQELALYIVKYYEQLEKPNVQDSDITYPVN